MVVGRGRRLALAEQRGANAVLHVRPRNLSELCWQPRKGEAMKGAAGARTRVLRGGRDRQAGAGLAVPRHPAKSNFCELLALFLPPPPVFACFFTARK